MKSNSSLSKLIPVMLCFFAMGFVDLVGIASNYVKADLGLTDSQANIFPSLVFFWFLIFSVPTGMLMSRIGQKKTVLLSLVVTFASLLLPVFGDSYTLMLLSFSLLGIGNALMQTSLNPLLSNIVRGDRLASSLTFGQFVKAIASFLQLVRDASVRGLVYFERDILARNLSLLNVQAYEFDGYVARISDMKSYFDENMRLLQAGNVDKLFNEGNPIYTKIRDDNPTRYLERQQESQEQPAG